MSSVDQHIQQFQKEFLKWSLNEYRIDSFNGIDLVIIGSFDLAYYYDLEIIFHEVDYIECPTYFSALNQIRLGTEEERQKLHAEHVVIVLENDEGGCYYISCNHFEYRWDRVKIY